MTPATQLVEGWWYYITCLYDGTPANGHYFQHQPGQLPVDPAWLAREAHDQLTIAYPVPHTSPPTDQPQLVGFPTWLWIDTDTHEPVSATASIPGLAVTATATPTTTTWNLGDGTPPVTCNGPGTPYTPTTDNTSGCTHTYQHHGHHTASVTTTWTTTWTATNGTTGTLPTTTRTTTFDLDVIQRQATRINHP